MTHFRRYLSTHVSLHRLFRRTGAVAMTTLTVFLFCGMTAPQSCSDSDNSAKGVVTAAAIGVGAVIAIGVYAGVHHAHHNMKGCLFMGPNGLQLQPDGSTQTYTMTGATANLKVGDQVRVHGSHQKKKKDATDQVFIVETLKKDYGSCRVPPPGSTAVNALPQQGTAEVDSVDQN